MRNSYQDMEYIMIAAVYTELHTVCTSTEYIYKTYGLTIRVPQPFCDTAHISIPRYMYSSASICLILQNCLPAPQRPQRAPILLV